MVSRTSSPASSARRRQEACSSQTEQIPAKQPRIYYGERMATDDYAIVGQADPDRNAEFDRPTGETGGERVLHLHRRGRRRDRLVHPRGCSTRSRSRRRTSCSPRRSTRTPSCSTCVTRGTGWRRSRRSSPWTATRTRRWSTAGSQWIVDGYTTSATYPYAERVNLQAETTDELTGRGTFQLARENVNYIRNSVKATVDAYDGTVTALRVRRHRPGAEGVEQGVRR